MFSYITATNYPNHFWYVAAWPKTIANNCQLFHLDWRWRAYFATRNVAHPWQGQSPSRDFQYALLICEVEFLQVYVSPCMIYYKEHYLVIWCLLFLYLTIYKSTHLQHRYSHYHWTVNIHKYIHICCIIIYRNINIDLINVEVLKLTEYILIVH